MTTEAGVAYVTLIPTTKGFSGNATKALSDGLTKPLRDAGDKAGQEIGTGIARGVDGQSGKMKNAAARVGDLFKMGLQAAGLAAGVLLVAGFASAVQTEAQTDKLVAQLGGSEFAEEMGEVAGNLYADAFGDSVAETGAAVRQVLATGLLPEDATNAQIEAMTAKALTFTDVLEQDMDMATQAVARMMRSGLVDSSEEAFDVLTRGIQQGADESGDLLETFQEYSTIFRELGISAEDATGLMIQGLKGGARDADKVADALKELSIRAQDGSETSAAGFEAIGLSAEEMTAKFAAGGAEARAGLDQVLDGLRGIEDPVERNAAAVALFGTQAEDMGDALMNLDLDGAAMRLGETEGATDKLGEAYDNAATRIESFKRGALMALTDFIGGQVIPAGERLAKIFGPALQSALDGVGPIVEQVSAFFSSLFTGFTEDEGTPVEMVALSIRDALLDLQPHLETFRDIWSEVSDFVSQNGELVAGALTGIGIAITAFLIPALIGLVAPMLAALAPFVLAGAAIAAIGAGFVWLYQNVEEFRAFVDQALPQVAEIFESALALVMATVDRTVQFVMFLWRTFGDEITATARIAMGVVMGLISGAMDVVQGLINVATAIMRGDWSAAWDGMKQVLSGWKTIALAIIKAAFGLMRTAISAGMKVAKAIFFAALNAVKDKVRSELDKVIGFFGRLGGRLTSKMSNVARAISGPFRSAFQSIKNLWNSIVGGFSFSIPDWVPGVGGNSFSIPTMHTGGIFEAQSGGEGLALLQSGEGVFTREQMAALGVAATQPALQGPPIVEILPGGDDLFMRWIQSLIRIRYAGDVDRALSAA